MTQYELGNTLGDAASSMIQDVFRAHQAKKRANKRLAAHRKMFAKLRVKREAKATAAVKEAQPNDEYKDEYPCTFTTVHDKPHALKVDCRLSSKIDFQVNAKTFELANLQTIITQVETLFQKVLDKLGAEYPQQVKDESYVNFYLDDTGDPNNGNTRISVNSKVQWEDWSAELIMAEVRKRAQSGKLLLLNQFTSITFQVVY